MRINTLISSGSYSRKLLVLYFLLFSDIFCNTFIVFCDFTEGLNEKYSKNTAAENGMMIGQLLNVLQCVFQLGLIFWFFFLIWKTFLFRFGLLGMLFREFRTFFLLLPANFTMFLVERLYRMVRYNYIYIYIYSITLWNSLMPLQKMLSPFGMILIMLSSSGSDY